jgi:hypothetical protein
MDGEENGSDRNDKGAVHAGVSCKTPVARVIEVASLALTRQQERGVGGQLWQVAIV